MSFTVGSGNAVSSKLNDTAHLIFIYMSERVVSASITKDDGSDSLLLPGQFTSSARMHLVIKSPTPSRRKWRVAKLVVLGLP